MNYELINDANISDSLWKSIIERSKKSATEVICLTSCPGFQNVLAQHGLKGYTMIDYVVGRVWKKRGNYRFFNQPDIPDGNKVEMFSDGSIFIKQEGRIIAREYLFPNTRRMLQDVRYLNEDGSLDHIEEYTTDGSMYSSIFYSQDKVQEIDYYDDDGNVVLRYYYYNGLINYITVEEPKGHRVLTDYDNLTAFLRKKVAELVRPEDSVNINYLGVELDVLAHVKSTNNTLFLREPPYDVNGEIRGNLKGILNNTIKVVQKVNMPEKYVQKIAAVGIDTKKIV